MIRAAASAVLAALAACSFPTKHPGTDDAGVADIVRPATLIASQAAVDALTQRARKQRSSADEGEAVA